MENKYLKRIADRVLQERLAASGAVLIEGPKWCGKTRTALENSKSHLFMQDPDKAISYLKAADTKPSLLLKGDTPRLLDEWQTAPGTLGRRSVYGRPAWEVRTIYFDRFSGSKGQCSATHGYGTNFQIVDASYESLRIYGIQWQRFFESVV